MKTLKRYINNFAFFTAMLVMVSCKKYLDVKSDMAQETIESLSSLEKLMDGSQYMNFYVNSFGEASADDYWLTDKTYNSFTEALRNTYIWQNFTYQHPNDWAMGYQPVYQANLVIDRYRSRRETDSEQERWNKVYGTALFFRAYQLMFQSWTYAKAYNKQTASTDQGVVLRLSSNPWELSVRSSNAVVYAQIIHDLRMAAQLLPDHADHPMRPSRMAGLAALSRVYLSMNDYEHASLYADSCLAMRHRLLDLNADPDIVPGNVYPFKQFNGETLFYAQLYTSANIAPSYALVDTLLYKQYDANDLRRTYYFTKNADNTVSFKGSYTGSNTLFGGFAMGEIYLVKAESMVRLGKIKDGTEWLNKLLVKRYKGYAEVSFTTSKEALDYIRKERRKELLMRGLRWMDIKRQNEDGAGLGLKRIVDGKLYELKPRSNRFALPIPQDVIEQSGIQQNPFTD